MVSLAFLIEAKQQRQSRQTTRTEQTRHRGSRKKPARPPVTTFVDDSGGRELIVRLLDIGQGDATYIRNGSSRVIIDGGPDTAAFGRYLDSLGLNNSTIDVVILSHLHAFGSIHWEWVTVRPSTPDRCRSFLDRYPTIQIHAERFAHYPLLFVS